MEKYSQITNHLRNGKLMLAGDGNQLKVSSIVDKVNKTNIPLASTMAYSNSINGFPSGGLASNQINYHHNVINDLIPYPSSAISTIIEKVNGTDSVYHESGRIINTSTPSKSPLESGKRRSKLGESNRLKKEDVAINFESINHHHNQQQSSPGATSSERGKVLEGTITISTSQQHQTVSSDEKVVRNNNISSASSARVASFDSDDIVRIVKQLQEKKENSTQTEGTVPPISPAVQQCNQYVQVSWGVENDGNDSNINELTRSNQSLRSTVDQLNYIVEQMSRERSATTLQMHSLSKTINAREAKIAELVAEREKQLADNDELRFAMKNIESLLSDYQSSLIAKTEEAEDARKGLAMATIARVDLQSALERTRVELRAKEDLVTELYRVNGLNQEEMAKAREYCAGLVDQLARSSKEAETTLLATKTELERRLEEATEAVAAAAAAKDHRLFQERQRQQRLQAMQAKCADLRTSLNALRASTLADLQSTMTEWTTRRDDIFRRMEVANLISSCAHSISNERLSSPKPLSRLHTSIEDIKHELQNIQESLTLE